jgi:hypothetical protein
MILKKIAEKFSEKLAFLTQNRAKLCKILIITLFFEKNAYFFAENCQKSQKNVIITSTPGHPCLIAIRRMRVRVLPGLNVSFKSFAINA